MTATTTATPRGLWMAFIAAFLGWMFDGFEIGLFPLVVQPAMQDMLPGATAGEIGKWIGVMTAAYLIGAATGGVVFGWLGDRIGRVRAMTLSILTYALVSGLCGFADAPWQLFALRFIASMGMGGEWSLGVSLVMELWPNKSRAWLAGLIGAAANVGFVVCAVLGVFLTQVIGTVEEWLLAVGISEAAAARLVSNSGWRLLMISGALPALLTFFIRMFVPESQRWLEDHGKGATRQWATLDMLTVVIGAAAALGLVSLWAMDHPLGLGDPAAIMTVRIIGTALGLVIAYFSYTYPVRRFLQRSMALESEGGVVSEWTPQRVLGRMILGATLSGIALLGTWASIQNASPWAGRIEEQRIQAANPALSEAELKSTAARPTMLARARTQIWSGVGAIIGTIIAALVGSWLGRRVSYFLLCVTSLGAALLFFQGNDSVDTLFFATVLLAGATTASFYGWLPLYLPELFPTRVRAFSQGFAYNFGRIVAAVGALQFGYLMQHVFAGSYPKACTVLSFIYVLGMIVIWLAPETHKHELPE